jgi:hypothetical protein
VLHGPASATPALKTKPAHDARMNPFVIILLLLGFPPERRLITRQTRKQRMAAAQVPGGKPIPNGFQWAG